MVWDAFIDGTLVVNHDYRLVDVITDNMGEQYILVKTG
jgi:hypothetical protein